MFPNTEVLERLINLRCNLRSSVSQRIGLDPGKQIIDLIQHFRLYWGPSLTNTWMVPSFALVAFSFKSRILKPAILNR